MLKIVAAGATALFVTASPIAYAQTPSAATPDQLNLADRNTLTDLRIDLVKAALQLTPDQQKYWPAIESAIRARAEDRKARLAKIAETVGKRADENSVEAMRNRDPIAFTKLLVPSRGSAWPPSRSLYSTIWVMPSNGVVRSLRTTTGQGYSRNWRATKQLEEVKRTSQPPDQNT